MWGRGFPSLVYLLSDLVLFIYVGVLLVQYIKYGYITQECVHVQYIISIYYIIYTIIIIIIHVQL